MPGLGHHIVDKATKIAVKSALEVIVNDLKSVALAILTPLTKTRWGTKLILAIGSIGSLAWLVSLDKIAGLHGAVAIAIIAVAYFVFRSKQEDVELECNCEQEGDGE